MRQPAHWAEVFRHSNRDLGGSRQEVCFRTNRVQSTWQPKSLGRPDKLRMQGKVLYLEHLAPRRDRGNDGRRAMVEQIGGRKTRSGISHLIEDRNWQTSVPSLTLP